MAEAKEKPAESKKSLSTRIGAGIIGMMIQSGANLKIDKKGEEASIKLDGGLNEMMDKVINNPKAKPETKAVAYQTKASLAAYTGDKKGAISYVKEAVDKKYVNEEAGKELIDDIKKYETPKHEEQS